MQRYEFDIVPTPKPRMTRSDKWKVRTCVARYRRYCDDLRRQASQLCFTVPPSGLTLLFVVPAPKSFSEKKRAELSGKPHQIRPDIDNLLKAFLDALCLSDAHIWDVHAVKRWGPTGKIIAFIENA